MIAQRCLYGVDKNPLAADLAKLSLWLATLAKDHPFTFLDHALRPGDSLIGFSRRQIAQFHWEISPTDKRVIGQEQLEKAIDRVTKYRQEILEMPEDNTYSVVLKQEKLGLADQALHVVRKAGDLLAAAFFFGEKPKEREVLRKTHLGYFAAASHGSLADIQKESEIIARLRSGQFPVTPFHWEIEFSEVFRVDAKGNVTGGFDVIVGNPPFMGGSKFSSTAGPEYTEWLSAIHVGSRGKSDLVAHFFRRAFTLLRAGGTFGLIATNTIRQGDTRETGLFWIRTNGGTIYRTETRKQWPGTAAVVVSVVHVIRDGALTAEATLNGRPVGLVTAYLFHMGPDASPSTLRSNHALVHSGTNINGKGFVISPELRDQFISECPSCSGRIRPYLGAEEMNETPDAAPTRFVIYLECLDEEQVKSYSVLYCHLYETVRVQRQESNEPRLRERWWLYSRPANELYQACAGMSYILASGRAGPHLCFAFQSTTTIFSDALTCFIYERHHGFAVLQSRVHEVWARFFGSSLKDDLRYIPEDCFQTFPLPFQYETNGCVESSGRTYYEHRAVLMAQNGGLTKTYNRFHDPGDMDPGVARLRELHDAMDRAVLDAYGWTDIQPKCEFLLDYEEEEGEEENGPRRRRKPWRYRWPDETRDEVLARLLELNRQRALEEGQVVDSPITMAAAAVANAGRKRRKKKTEGDSVQKAEGLFAKSKGE